jgi:hypothetical protein
MLKDELEEIRNIVLEKRKQKDEREFQNRVKEISEKYSKIISDLVSGLTSAANHGYASFTLKNVKDFYVSNESELYDWARSEKISLTFKTEQWFISEHDDRSKIKVTEITASF